MSNLTGKCPVIPAISYDTKRRKWMLVFDYTFTIENQEYQIPTGFTFDLASIPRLLWAFTAPFELSIAAPLVHDYLYQTGGVYGRVTRKQADIKFKDLMKAEGVSLWRREIAYRAVRVFGKKHWRDIYDI
jgi:hypothetical protein